MVESNGKRNSMSLVEQVEADQITITDAVQEQLQNTPWWMASIAFHLLVGLILMFVLTGEAPPKDGDISFVTSERLQEKPDQKRATRPPKPNENRKQSPDRILKELTPAKDNDQSKKKDDPFNTLTLKPINFEPKPENSPPVVIYEELAPSDPAAGFKMPMGDGKKFKNPFANAKRKIKNGPDRVPGGQKAVDLGLKWLADNQNTNGSWDVNPTDTSSPGKAGHYKIAVTGFALAAFCGDGHTEKYGKYKKVIRKALKYLKSVQTPEGAFSANMYAHGIATLGVAECVAMGGTKESRDMLIDAIQNAADRQHKLGGWGYSGPRFSDSSVTGFMAQALHSALYDKRLKKMSLVRDTWDRTISCFRYMRTDDGSTGYRGPGRGSVRLRAVGALMSIFNDEGIDNEWVAKAADGLPKTPDLQDMYGTYYQTLVKFQMTGSRKNRDKYKAGWNQWRDGLAKLTDLQGKEGANKGSWFFSKNYGKSHWGRTGDTAISCMCLELRYPIQNGSR